MPVSDGRTRIIVAVCTYKRNEPLACLLTALTECAARVRTRAAVGVVVVDDTAEGKAREVVEAFADCFELGVTYRISGHANISLARNLAMETAMELGDWIAMTDDDCEPVPDWFAELMDVQARTGADTVTGEMVGRAPPGSPRWITEQPFLEFWPVRFPDGAPMDRAFTNNSFMSTRWLKEHPDVRFDPNLGVIGGEDMVFFRTAQSRGMKIHYAANGFVYENEPPSRVTLSYQLRRALWIGNTSYVTCVRDGTPPVRMFIHGIGSLIRAIIRPIQRLGSRQAPQWRYGLFLVLRAFGVLSGFFGVKLKHH